MSLNVNKLNMEINKETLQEVWNRLDYICENVEALHSMGVIDNLDAGLYPYNQLKYNIESLAINRNIKLDF